MWTGRKKEEGRDWLNRLTHALACTIMVHWGLCGELREGRKHQLYGRTPIKAAGKVWILAPAERSWTCLRFVKRNLSEIQNDHQQHWKCNISVFCLLQLQEEGEEGKIKRPEVRDEDLIKARDNLAFGTQVKSKTFEVMEECGEWSDDRVNTLKKALYVCHTKE